MVIHFHVCHASLLSEIRLTSAQDSFDAVRFRTITMYLHNVCVLKLCPRKYRNTISSCGLLFVVSTVLETKVYDCLDDSKMCLKLKDEISIFVFFRNRNAGQACKYLC